MSNPSEMTASGMSLPRPESQLPSRHHLARRVCLRLLAQLEVGSLTIHDGGETFHFGAAEDGAQKYANLNVQMSGPAGITARWSVASAADETSAVMTVIAARGQLRLDMPAAEDQWSLSASEDAALGKILGRGFSADQVVDVVEKIVDTYLELREEGEAFIETYRRIGQEPFKERVYGTA